MSNREKCECHDCTQARAGMAPNVPAKAQVAPKPSDDDSDDGDTFYYPNDNGRMVKSSRRKVFGGGNS